MPGKRKIPSNGEERVGRRLARLRKAAGYSQTELAAEIGISRRMVAYYEAQTDHPPTTLLPLLTRALNVSADTLLGLRPPTPAEKPADMRLRQRLKRLEKLPPRERRKVLDVVDALLDRARSKASAGA